MKVYFFLQIVLSLALVCACTGEKSSDRVMAGSKGDQGPKGETGQSCTSERLESGKGVLVKCGETQVELKDGEPGISCTLQKGDPTSTLTCGGTTISLSSNPDSTDLPTCTIREEANKDKVVDCAGKVAIVHYDVCRLMSLPDHPKLKVLRCGDEYSVVKSDNSFLALCLSADETVSLFHDTPDFKTNHLITSDKAECFKQVKEIGTVTDLNLFTIHSEMSLDFLLEFKNLTKLDLQCFEDSTVDLSKLTGIEQLTTLTVSDHCLPNNGFANQSTAVVFPLLPNLKSLSLYGIAADFKDIGLKFPKLSDLYLAGYYSTENITADFPSITKSLADIGVLVNLKRVNIVSDIFSDFTPLTSLTKLEQLNLVNLPNLNDISFLADGSVLTKLRRLILNHTGVQDLAPLKDRASQVFPVGNVTVPFEFSGYEVKYYVQNKQPFNAVTCPGADSTNPERNSVEAYCSKMKKSGY